MDYQREFLQAVKNGQLPKVSALCANKNIDINKTDQVHCAHIVCMNLVAKSFRFLYNVCVI